jgi:pyruvate-formate lyase-activating enzyme
MTTPYHTWQHRGDPIYPMNKPTISLVLATDGTCNVACKTCPTGSHDPDDEAGRMSMDTFDRIVNKAQAEANVLSCCLYYFNEPMLHPDICKMLKSLKARGLYAFISTNLSFAPDSVPMKRVHEMMLIRTENIIVSVSGWNQNTHVRSHKNGNIDYVKRNMESMAELRMPETFLRLSWHDYHYNKDEAPLMRCFAESLGFKWTPYGTGVLPLERVLARWQDGLVDEAEADIMVKLPEAKKLCWVRKHWNCHMQEQTFTVDWAGNVYNCSDRNNPTNWRGSFFSGGTVADFLARRKTDPDCVACKAIGGHVYAAQEYTTPLFNPVRHLDRLYRKLGLQWKLKTLSPKLWRKSVEGFYNRPKE